MGLPPFPRMTPAIDPWRPGQVGEHVDRTLGWPQSGRSAWRMCSLANVGLGILPNHEISWDSVEIWKSMRILIVQDGHSHGLCWMCRFDALELCQADSEVRATVDYCPKLISPPRTPRKCTLYSEERTEELPFRHRFVAVPAVPWWFSGVHRAIRPAWAGDSEHQAEQTSCAKMCVLLRSESVWRRAIPRKFGGGLDLPARYPWLGASRKLRFAGHVLTVGHGDACE